MDVKKWGNRLRAIFFLFFVCWSAVGQAQADSVISFQWAAAQKTLALNGNSQQLAYLEQSGCVPCAMPRPMTTPWVYNAEDSTHTRKIFPTGIEFKCPNGEIYETYSLPFSDELNVLATLRKDKNSWVAYCLLHHFYFGQTVAGENFVDSKTWYSDRSIRENFCVKVAIYQKRRTIQQICSGYKPKLQ